MLEITDLHKRFGARVLFSGAKLSIAPGTALQLDAPNGSGKTSLLRIITGTLLPDAGSIRFNGSPISPLRGRVGFCPAEDDGFYPRISVRENLEFFGALYGLQASAVEARVGQFPLAIDFLSLPIERCSLGMRQKVKLARAFLHEPDLVLLDEPFNGLDQPSRESFLNWLNAWIKKSKSAMVVQHGWKSELPKQGIKDGKILPISKG